jgi:hypothetical protein
VVIVGASATISGIIDAICTQPAKNKELLGQTVQLIKQNQLTIRQNIQVTTNYVPYTNLLYKRISQVRNIKKKRKVK